MLDICRLCLGISSVDKTIDENCDLFLKIIRCLPVKPSLTDVLPKKICNNCVQNVENINEYFNIIISADNKLNSISASGVDALTAFYEEILNCSDLKKERDSKNTDIRSVVIKELPCGFNSSKNTQTFKHVKIKSESEEIEKEEIVNNNFTIASNLVHLKYEHDSVPETKFNQFNIENNITHVALSPGIEKEPKIEKNHSVESRKKRKIKIDTDVEIRRQCTKREIKPSAKDVKPSEENSRVKKSELDDEKNIQCVTCFVNISSRSALQHYKDHVVKPEVIKNSAKMDGNTDSSKLVMTKNEHTAEKCDEAWVYLDNGAQKPYQCLKCNKEFRKRKGVKQHMLSHLVDRPYICNLCGHTFKQPKHIILHSQIHDSTKTFYCKYEDCDYSSNHSNDLKKHHHTHNPTFKYTCKTCEKGFNVLTWFLEHENLHTGAKPFVCDLCGKSFIYKRYLRSHLVVMHPDSQTRVQVHRCVECGEEFKHTKTLRRHRDRHATEGKHLCNICGKTLSSAEHLKFHIHIHEGYKPHKCETCGKGFVQKHNLTEHERVHSGERPYVCLHCNKGFSQRSSLVIHQRNHSGERPYVCPLCNKGFTAKGLLTMHSKHTCV